MAFGSKCFLDVLLLPAGCSQPFKVSGCLEGVFAQGQVYVLCSRVTDPDNLCFVGIPPADLVDEVVAALREAGYDVEVWFSQALSVTGEWTLRPGPGTYKDRLTPKWKSERTIPLKHRALAEVLNPQPKARDVIQAGPRAAKLSQAKPVGSNKTKAGACELRSRARSAHAPTLPGLAWVDRSR